MIPRNDPQAALVAFKAEWKRSGGRPDPDLCETLLMLQDDPAEYEKLVDAFLDEQGSTK